MMFRRRHPSPFAAALLLVTLAAATLAAAACGGDGGDPAAPGDDARPVITVSGVEDGASVTAPVTITISVDVGTFEAELNGEPFISGSTVEAPGEYTLAVTARNGAAVAVRTVAFTIRPAPGAALVVRLFDLGPNDAGGGGDAVLVTDSSGAGIAHALYDVGPAGAGGSDPDFVGRRLASLGVDTLELLVLSHAHSDHFRGIPGVLERVHVRRFVHNDQERSFPEYRETLSDAVARADSVFVPGTPLVRTLGGGGTEVQVLPPLPDHLDDPSAGSSEINEGSLGTRVSRGGFALFLAGDGEVAANRRWRIDFGSLTAGVDVLKVGHHGANDAIFDGGFDGASSWLDHTSPAWAVISANGTTHPRVNALAELRSRAGVTVYCTPTHGDITIRVDGADRVGVTVERNADRACEAGDEATT